MKTIILSLLLTTVAGFSQVNRYDQPSGRYDQPSGQKYVSTYAPIDFDLYEKILKETEEANKRKMLQLKERYLSATNYPATISEGIHSVELTDNIATVVTIDVGVHENKVSYLLTKNGRLDVDFSSEINKGKALIKFSFNGQSGYYDAYFIQDIFK